MKVFQGKLIDEGTKFQIEPSPRREYVRVCSTDDSAPLSCCAMRQGYGKTVMIVQSESVWREGTKYYQLDRFGKVHDITKVKNKKHLWSGERE